MGAKEQEPTQIKESGRSRWLKGQWENSVWRAKRIRAMIGHPVSQDTREKIGKANRDRCRTPEYRRQISLERGGVWVKVYPLLLRGGIVEEVAKITGLQKKQIENLRNHLRKRGGLKRPTKEEERQAKRKAHLGKPSQSHERLYTSSQERAFTLARKFLEANLFIEDLSAWNELQELYHRYGRPLPEDFADQLRLEVFLRARSGIEKRDMESVIKYRDLGDEVDSFWFEESLVEEEQFIIWARLGYGVDRKGLFRPTEQGEFRPVEVVDGSLVMEDLDLIRRREISQKWSPRRPSRQKD